MSGSQSWRGAEVGDTKKTYTLGIEQGRQTSGRQAWNGCQNSFCAKKLKITEIVN